MARRPEIGNVQLYPDRPLNKRDKNGYVLKFYCPIQQKRIRKNCGTRDRREARKILRECRERLLNGLYVESGGAITAALDATRGAMASVFHAPSATSDKSWAECVERYKDHCKNRMRESSQADSASRLRIAERILESRREDAGLPPGGSLAEFTTLESLEYLQDRLLEGDECRYDVRSPMTVNTTIGAIMTFVRYCHDHQWIDRVPPIKRLEVGEVMKGRPITTEEFGRMINAVPGVVGARVAESWQRVLNVLWESAFRVADVMDFSWDDQRRIHPVWPQRSGDHPTIAIPGTQKNKKVQEIPMLPGLQALLADADEGDRHGWIVNPLPIDYQIRSKAEWFKPTPQDLNKLANQYSNSAIGRACGVSETTVRKWLKQEHIQPSASNSYFGDIDPKAVITLRERSVRSMSHVAQRSKRRLTKERVGRIISSIGEAAAIIVREADPEAGRRQKFASAHDIRRGCAQRLINAGISAETLKLVLRHKDFKTTEQFYGATRAAQSAAGEIHQRLSSADTSDSILARKQLSVDEVAKLRSLLDLL